MYSDPAGQSSPPPPAAASSSAAAPQPPSQPQPQQPQPQPAASSSSGWGGFFAKAKNVASQVATATSVAVSQGVDATKRTVAEMKAQPTTIQCSGCPALLEVPPTLFDWTCPSGHNNRKDDVKCSTANCNAARPIRNDPLLQCSVCHNQTAVPQTNAMKSLQVAVAVTKKAVSSAATTVKDQVNYAAATPDTFHCRNCNSLLAVPQGPWMCQTCTKDNAEDAKQCVQCQQKKTDQKAICGVCRQSTPIPSTNFMDGLVATARDIQTSSRKIYYDVAGKPYVTCGRCANPVRLPERAPGLRMAEPPQPQGQASQPPPAEGSSSSSSAEGQGAPPPAYASDAEMHGLVCSSCKNPLE